jgi:hypothetical protein
MERSRGDQIPEQQLEMARAFSETIEKITGPIPKRPERDPSKPRHELLDSAIFDPDPWARKAVKIGKAELEYTFYEGSSGEFNFRTSHTVELAVRAGAFGSITTQAHFGVREDGMIVRRTHAIGHGIVAPHTDRELDPQRSLMLLTFIDNPLQHGAMLPEILRLDDDEREEQAREISRADASYAEYLSRVQDRRHKVHIPSPLDFKH